MPLLLICGRPCSGKTTITKQVATALEHAGCEVIIVDEPTAHIDKHTGHQDAHVEKTTRGLLKAATHRALQRPNAAVLLDYTCGIKGYRYELWCMARERATRCALLHCTVPRDVADAWRRAAMDDCAHAEAAEEAHAHTNQINTATGAYTPHPQHVFDDLWQRFEVPDTRNRWDRPLIEVDPRDPNAVDEAVAAAITALLGRMVPGTCKGVKADGPGDAVQADSIASIQASLQSTVLMPTVATSRQLPTDTTRRTMIDRATQAVVQRVLDAQAACGGVAPVQVSVEGGNPVTLPECVPLGMLRGHKRSFMRIATQVLGGRVDSEAAVQRMFLEYIVERCR